MLSFVYLYIGLGYIEYGVLNSIQNFDPVKWQTITK